MKTIYSIICFLFKKFIGKISFTSEIEISDLHDLGNHFELYFENDELVEYKCVSIINVNLKVRKYYIFPLLKSDLSGFNKKIKIDKYHDIYAWLKDSSLPSSLFFLLYTKK